MAKVPIEVVTIGENGLAEIPAAIALANSEQNEFIFSSASEDLVRRMRMQTFELNNVSEFFDHMERIRTEVRGYYPFLIAAIDSELQGTRFCNLFGSHRAEKGIAALTTSNVTNVIIPSDRMVAYFIYYFARYALSFISPIHRNHDDSRGCVFDRKIDKQDIVKSMRARALCDECRRNLITGGGMLSAAQFAALENLFALAGRILNEGLDSDGRARIFIGSSSEGLRIANKLQELLSNNFSVIVWDQGTVFGLGSSTLEALEAAVLEFKYAVFVFTPDDELHSRGEAKPVARDNVLFELGMFVGKLGRRRAFAIHPGKRGIALPSDLSGITTAPYDPEERNLAAALGPVANRIRESILTTG